MIKKYLVCLLILIIGWCMQQYYAYLKINTYTNVNIYWYNNDNVMVLRNYETTTLIDMDTSTRIITYNTNDIIFKKEKFNLFKNVHNYTATITFTEEFLNELEIGGQKYAIEERLQWKNSFL